MLSNTTHSAELNSPNQTIKAKVELYNGSTLVKTCTCEDVLAGFSVERAGEGKFFGYGICQKLKADLVDINREITITKSHIIKVAFGVGTSYIYPFPDFYPDEITRDETSNLISIVAYDALYKANSHTVNEVGLAAPYTIQQFAAACAALLGISALTIGSSVTSSFATSYPEGANFGGNETIRSALDAIAEATQTIYFISGGKLRFRRIILVTDGLTIGKDKYIDLTTDGARTLGAVIHTTELGDSVMSAEPSTKQNGVTQYIRDNPFWDMREDIGTLVEAAQTAIAGLTIEQFECNWIGNYLLEIGDKINLTKEDDSIVSAYVLDDTITFDGTLSQLTRWEYDENEAESASNPSSLGDALNKTYARVDKANKRIDLVVNDVTSNSESIAGIKVEIGGINLYVEQEVENLKKRTELIMDEDAVDIAIKRELANGVDKVTTAEKHFTFDDTGLNISETGKEIKTQITSDGMQVFKNDDAVLTANNKGVNARNLQAITYLIIGNTSRLEDWKGRTACFWTGGN